VPRKVFVAGEILTAADVNANLMDQAVMTFADAAARTTAIPSPTEGMVTYLASTKNLQRWTGSAWVNVVSGFTARALITTNDASWAVPSLQNPIVKVTVIGGGGGGGGTSGNGGNGTSSEFNASSAGTITAAGGLGGVGGQQASGGRSGTAGFASGNGGGGAMQSGSSRDGTSGTGGAIAVNYLNLTGISTVNVTVGSGGTGGTDGPGGAGGRGEVIVEYVAA
jgi:hypothetical protein